MKLLTSIISGIFESIWRRWYGGWIEHNPFEPKWLYKLLSSRGTQTIVNFIILFTMFMINSAWMTTPLCSWLISHNVYGWILAIIMTAIFQFEFWSRGHGPAFDEGRGNTDESTINRYQKVWWAIIPNALIPQKHWYGFLYDYIWMTVRYTIGLFLMVPFLWSFNILWLGLIVSSAYALCWTISERDEWVFNYIPFNMAKSATQLAELLVGFITGFWLLWF